MADLVVVCALDHFGAEVARKARDLDILVQRDERILWLWAGPGSAPEMPGRQTGDPLWSTGPDADRLKLDAATKLHAGFDRQAEFATLKPIAAECLQVWNRVFDAANHRPDERLCHLVLTGSLADPRSALRALAFYAAYCETPSLWGGWRLRAAWALGRNTGGDELPEALREAATAISLRDLAAMVATQTKTLGHDWLPPFPQYLAGNGRRLGDVLPTRSEAALLCALTVLGSVHHIRSRLSTESLFSFRHEQDTAATWIGLRPFDSVRPFAALGAAVVLKHQALLLEALATRLARGVLAEYARQDVPANHWGPEIETGSPLAGLMVKWCDALRDDLRRELIRRGYDQACPTPIPFSVAAVKLTVGWDAFFGRFRSQIDAVFGWNEFSKRPLESWEYALNELNSLADRFFLADRQRHLRQFVGASVESLDAALRARFDAIALESASSEFPAPLQPHLVSRRLAAAAESSFAHLAEEDRKTRVQEREELCSESDVTRKESNLNARFRHLLSLVRSVPSPLAIFVRVLLVLAVSLFCFGLAEFPYFAQLTPQQVALARLGQALLVGGVVGVWLLVRAFRLKAELRAAFDEWFKLKREYFRERHLRMELDTREELFAALCEYFRWLRESPETAAWKPFHEFSATAQRVAGTWPLQRGPLAEPALHEFLHTYPQQFAQALAAWDAELFRVVERFTECRREFLLPYIPRQREGVRKLERLLARAWPGLAGTKPTGKEEALDLLARCREANLSAPAKPALPYLQATRSRSDEAPEWLGTWRGFSAPDGPGTAPSPAGQFASRVTATIAAYLRAYPGPFERTLTRWLLEDVYEVESWEKVGDLHPALWTLIDTTKQPPLAGNAGQAAPLREIWMPGANHFTDSFDPERRAPRYDMKTDDDIDRPFYAILTLLPALTADDVIHGPGGEKSPDNLLGKHLAEQSKAAPLPGVLNPLN